MVAVLSLYPRRGGCHAWPARSLSGSAMTNSHEKGVKFALICLSLDSQSSCRMPCTVACHCCLLAERHNSQNWKVRAKKLVACLPFLPLSLSLSLSLSRDMTAVWWSRPIVGGSGGQQCSYRYNEELLHNSLWAVSLSVRGR